MAFACPSRTGSELPEAEPRIDLAGLAPQAQRFGLAVELLLQALGFCYAVGYVANAAARGIEIGTLQMQVEGDLDVGNFLGLAGPRPGFTAIRATARVSSPNASEEQLRDLCQYVQDSSPVRDCLANPVPVKTTLELL